MPSRGREEDDGQRRRDPYNRAWLKVPTETLDRERFSDLSHPHFGVLARMMLFSVFRSYDVGYFSDKATNQPMSRAHIVKAIRPHEGDNAEHDAQATAALDAFLQCGLAHEDELNGYYFDAEIFESWLHENNRIAKREADARRARDYRARQRQLEREAEKQATKPPTPDPAPTSTNGHGGPKLVSMTGRRKEERA